MFRMSFIQDGGFAQVLRVLMASPASSTGADRDVLLGHASAPRSSKLASCTHHLRELDLLEAITVRERDVGVELRRQACQKEEGCSWSGSFHQWLHRLRRHLVSVCAHPSRCHIRYLLALGSTFGIGMASSIQGCSIMSAVPWIRPGEHYRYLHLFHYSQAEACSPLGMSLDDGPFPLFLWFRVKNLRFHEITPIRSVHIGANRVHSCCVHP